MSSKIKAFFSLKRAGNDFVVTRVSDLLERGYDADQLAHDFVRINREVWGAITKDEYLWTVDKVKSHFKICPQTTYCAFANGKMVATLNNIFTTEEELRKNKSWLEKTGNGYLTTHVPTGNLGFGVDLSVTREAPKKVSDKLVLATVLVGIIGEGLKAGYIGSRIPSYHKHRDIKVEDYVYGKRRNGKPLDPELYFYLKDGFEIEEIIPEYMDDPDSLNYGVLIRWDNPLYRVTKALPFLKPVIRWIGKKLFLRLPEDIGRRKS